MLKLYFLRLENFQNIQFHSFFLWNRKFYRNSELNFFNKVIVKNPYIGKCGKHDEILHQIPDFSQVETKLSYSTDHFLKVLLLFSRTGNASLEMETLLIRENYHSINFIDYNTQVFLSSVICCTLTNKNPETIWKSNYF